MTRGPTAIMPTRLAMAASLALALSGCEAASDIAGDAVNGEIRNAVAMQCAEVAGNAGIVSGRIAQVCECTAERFLADPDLSLADIDPARVEQVVNSCARKTDPNMTPMPTEETGG